MTSRPQDLIDLPEHVSGRGFDLLSRVLGHIRLAGDKVVARTLAGGTALDGAEVVGACLFILASGDGILHDAEGVRSIGSGDLLLLPDGFGSGRFEVGPSDAEVLLCRFRFDARSLRAMVLALPRLVHVSRARGTPWLSGIIHFLRVEAEDDQPGAALMVSRLIELIVIRALRTWAQEGSTLGWLGGLADPRIARALAIVHADPSRLWALDPLANAVGMSRSNFCDRFTALVGRPPLRYQSELRLTLARDLLLQESARVGEVGLRVGYGSEAAFSRAYKAMFGRSPALDRRSRAAAGKPQPIAMDLD